MKSQLSPQEMWFRAAPAMLPQSIVPTVELPPHTTHTPIGIVNQWGDPILRVNRPRLVGFPITKEQRIQQGSE